MGIRLTVTILACGLGAFVGVYHWISWQDDARTPSTRHEQAPEMVVASQSAPPTRPSRMRLAAPLPAQSTAGSEPVGFRRLAALSLGSPVDAVAIGDVTGDGRDDVVASTHQIRSSASHPSDFKLSVFVQQADGRLAPPLQAPFPGFSMHKENKSIVLVDLDEDGLREILLGYDGGIHVFEGAASGHLLGRDVPDGSGSVTTLVTLDVNRDGNADLASFDGFNIKVYLGDGRGALQSASTVSTWPATGNSGHAHMAAGDLNGDGRLDLAVYNGNSQAAVFVQTGNATFERWPYIFSPYPATTYSALAVADFDGDGDHDIMFATHGTNRNHPHAQHRLIRQSGGKLELATPVRWDVYNIATAMIGADMDRDGREDVLVVRTPTQVIASIGYSRQRYDGSFDDEVRFPLTYPIYMASPRGLAAGDFTGDGCSDIAAASDAYLVLLQAECAPRRMSRPLPPQRVESPAAASSGAVSARQTNAPIDDMALIRTGRRPASPISEPRKGVRRRVR